MKITQEHITQYEEQGYFVLEAALPNEQLEGLRSEAQRYIDMMHAEMDAQGVDTLNISHRDKRYFIANRHDKSPILSSFLFSDLMAAVTGAVLGENVYLMFEQYVIKAAEKGMKFGWHQDSAFIGFEHTPYLTCWCALDDMTEENGTIYVLPYDRAGTRELVEHSLEEGTNDRVGYHGDDPGVPVIVPAGSIALFSSTTFHRSGTNTTDKMRRVYLAQYSARAMVNTSGKGAQTLAVPFSQGGERVKGPVSV